MAESKTSTLTDTLIGGRYRIRERLGKGATGEVYKAHDTRLEVAVAVKVMAGDLGDCEARTRFTRQAVAAARIQHPGVVRVLDRSTEQDPQPFVVMELLEGRTLAHRLSERGALRLAEALALAAQLARAVAAIHAVGIIHRDLKPSNLFLVEAPGELPLLKVIDFGVVRFPVSGPRLTRTQEVFGTLSYMAPEQWLDTARAEIAADVYAMSVILYEMITGRLPFDSTSRGELRLAVLNDDADDLRVHRPDAPQGLALAVAAGLAKDPAARPPSARAWLDAILPYSSYGAGEGRAELFDPGPRFALRGVLGRGAHGEVFEAQDRELGRAIAIKRLRHVNGRRLTQLKQEFRTLQDIRHPNVVRLFELIVRGGEAFFSMERLFGLPLLEHLVYRPDSLSETLAQAATALSMLNDRGIVHRDVKPEHLIIEPDGRAVLIDFGLSASSQAAAPRPAGTLPYMAPEAVDGFASPAADRYAFGRLVHDALEVVDGQNAGASLGGLRTLATQLCSEEPGARPPWSAVRAALNGSSDVDDDSSPGRREEPFVGREYELSLLMDAFSATSTGQFRTVVVEGKSGMGKSFLLQRFVRQLPGHALVLNATARRAETVPFPAFDTAVDDLARYLGSLPERVARALVPRHLGALATLFPVLRRWTDAQDEASTESMDLDLLRDRAFEALRRLLFRVAEQVPLVIVVDDVQWADTGTIELISRVFFRDAPPEGLLVFVQRPLETSAGDHVAGVLAVLQKAASRIAVGALSASESEDLLRRMGWSGGDVGDFDQLHLQTGGDPFLLALTASGRRRVLGEHAVAAVLQERVDELPFDQRRLLELCSIASRPLSARLLLKAAGADHIALADLENARLLRRVTVVDESVVEPYHARVRAVVLDGIAVGAKAAHHGALVSIVRTMAPSATELLVEHLVGAGQVLEAGALAMQAAREAIHGLAFDRAAELYGVALASDQMDSEVRGQIQWAQAEAYLWAGRPAAASDCLLRALEGAPPERAKMLRRTAGQWLLSSGDRDRGLYYLEQTLDEHGLTLARDFEAVFAQVGELFGQLQQRGLAFQQREEAECDPAALERVDLQLELADSLSHVDLQATPFVFRSLLLALDLGEARRLQRAAAIFVWHTASHLPNDLVEPVLEICERLTPIVGQHLSDAWFQLALAEWHHMRMDLSAAEAACEAAERILVTRCRGAGRALAGARNGIAFIHYAHTGDFSTRADDIRRWLEEADARREVYQASYLRSVHGLYWMAKDDPCRARQELETALTDWPGGTGLFELGVALMMDSVNRYARSGLDLPDAMSGSEELLASPAADAPLVRSYVEFHRAYRGLLFLSQAVPGAKVEAVESAIANLRSLDLPTAKGLALACEANLYALRDDLVMAAQLMDEAERQLRALTMLSWAASARMRRGEFAGQAQGLRLRTEAEAELRALGMESPSRWCATYFSPFPVGPASLLTQHHGRF